MPFYSLVVIAHDELGNLPKDKDLGKKIEEAVLKFSTGSGPGDITVHHSDSVMKVVASFNSDKGGPLVLISEGWGSYVVGKQVLPDYLAKYFKSTARNMSEIPPPTKVS